MSEKLMFEKLKSENVDSSCSAQALDESLKRDLQKANAASGSHIIIRRLKPEIEDSIGRGVSESAHRFFGLELGEVCHTKVFSIFLDLTESELRSFAENGLQDRIIHDISFYSNGAGSRETSPREVSPVPPQNSRNGADFTGDFPFILVAKHPGVTDDEGYSAQCVLEDLLGKHLHGKQCIFTQDLYIIKNRIPEKDLARFAREWLGNPLINRFSIGTGTPDLCLDPRVHLVTIPEEITIPLPEDDAAMESLSRERMLALNLAEMQAVRLQYSRPEVRSARKKLGLPEDPTMCELEIIAQTWSEHCKHKEFAAKISYHDLDTGEKKEIDSLFQTYIKDATAEVKRRLAARGHDRLVKVFSDNAGVVRIDEKRLFVWKVETHNTPSALDPYGGALTGIVGNNRDPMGTGRGGARLLFNTDVLCFAPPDYAGELFPGQLHPRRVLLGVCRGIEHGGNKSGVPTVNGSVVFDERYRGKPLVFCGTGAILRDDGKEPAAWDKPISPGDLIFMAGGRVGKDGIHGATFSSLEIDEHSPHTAVQIGSPFTQKMLSDFLEKACADGLIKSCTDNGAGGLSSSIGELASICGGARVQLEMVPLKYPGLQPWEIFVSESQERMTLVIEPRFRSAICDLARHYEVEVSEIGVFTSDGNLDVRFGESRSALLDLDFLHDGTPKKQLYAEWRAPTLSAPNLPAEIDYGPTLSRLMGTPNICSRERIVRRFDHEVKGRTIVKPFMGGLGRGPQDAAVVRIDFDSWAGLAISNGILPRYGDLDAYQMSAGAFDEAVRQIVAVGGEIPGPDVSDKNFWSVNDNFCVPDSVYDASSNPDGLYKLAQLVRMCEALRDMSVFYEIPMTSGKDSMKNDYRHGTVRISVPPTILYSMVAKIEDVRTVVTSDFKMPGDHVYLIGKTYDELGGSEFLRLFGQLGNTVPKVRCEEARERYRNVAKARSLLRSCHDCSDGGFAVALTECCIGGACGAEIEIPGTGLAPAPWLFSESHSRFVASVAPENRTEFEKIFGNDCTHVGRVSAVGRLLIRVGSVPCVDLPLDQLVRAWRCGLDAGLGKPYGEGE